LTLQPVELKSFDQKILAQPAEESNQCWEQAGSTLKRKNTGYQEPLNTILRGFSSD
jgi:hypothetical protein